MTIPKVFTSLVKKHEQKTAFCFEDQKWTFADVSCTVKYLTIYAL